MNLINGRHLIMDKYEWRISCSYIMCISHNNLELSTPLMSALIPNGSVNLSSGFLLKEISSKSRHGVHLRKSLLIAFLDLKKIHPMINECVFT